MKVFLQVLILLIILHDEAISQLEYSNWYFGNHVGITFNTSDYEPMFRPGNVLSQFEGMASISSAQGNILLYTNGEYVINRFGSFMNIGNPLYGHQSSSQSAIILPKQGLSNQYYLFTADAGEYTGQKNRGINYSVIDAGANSGQGEFLEMNIPLLPEACEQLTATHHANGKDYWVVARGWKNNNFYAYLVTENGIEDTVITSIGFTRTSNYHTIGCLKFSPNGGMAALPAYDEEFFELFRFDNKSGVFYDRIQIDIPDQRTLYCPEFSANGRVLYVSSSKNPNGFFSIYQIDVSEYNKSKISASVNRLVHREGHIGTIQRAINNKIYIAQLDISYVHSIENPNNLGITAGFVENRIMLMDSLCQLGLPQNFNPVSNYRNITVCEDSDVILDTDDFLYDTIRYTFSYQWTGPNGYVSNLPKPTLKDIAIADSGAYILRANYFVNGSPVTTEFTYYIRVGKRFKFNIIGESNICKGQMTTLSSDTINNTFQYIWSNGRRGPFINVGQQGLYKLQIRSEFGCIDSAEFYLNVFEAPEAEIEGPRLLCENRPIELKSAEQSDDYSYLWSNGDTTSSIIVEQPGDYRLIISNQYGCKDSSTVKVVRYPDLKVKITGDTIWCTSGLARLYADITPYDSTLRYSYRWSTGDSTQTIFVSKSDNYAVVVTIEDNCSYTDAVTVVRADMPRLTLNINSNIELCDGENISVNLVDKADNVYYYWADGDTIFPRNISKSGNYKVFAKNKAGCINEYEFSVTIIEKPKAEITILDADNICNADSLVLSAYPKGEQYTYLWLNNSSRNDEIVVKQSGYYTVVVFHENGCSDTVALRIELGQGLPVRITGRSSHCYGEILELTATVSSQGGSSNLSFLWSTGDTLRTIFVSEPGEYSVFVKHVSGCEGSDTINVVFYEVPELILNYTEPQKICEGETVTVTAENFNPAFTYYWNDGSYRLPREFGESGTYTLYVVNAGFCIDSALFTLEVVKNPTAKIRIPESTKICKNQTLDLFIDIMQPDITYKWSDGSLSGKLTVSEPGMYYLTAINLSGCQSKDSIMIENADEPDVVLSLSTPYLCPDDDITVNASGQFSEVIWEDGSRNTQYKTNKSGYVHVSVISSDGCVAVDSIKVIMYSNPVIIEIEDIDFGTVCAGEKEVRNISISNYSNLDIQILNISDLSGTPFRFEQNLIGRTINSGSKFDLRTIFNPSVNGMYSQTVKVVYKHICPDSIEFTLSGVSSFSSEISLPELTAISGESLCIPISYKFDCIDEVNFNSSSIMKISFDGSYFVPESVSRGNIIRNELLNGIRFLDISFDNVQFNNIEGILAEICGTALIGSDIPSELLIDDYKWDDYIEVNLKNGSIRNEVCAIEIRSIQYFKPTNINITPNPATDLIKVNVISQEKGIFVLELINSNGITVHKDVWQNNSNEIQNLNFDLPVTDFSTGVYMLRLISPWDVKSSNVVIVK